MTSTAATKKTAPVVPAPKAEMIDWVRLDLRVEPELDKQIEGWRKKQDKIPSKNEALRMLLRLGLSTHK